jgi:hypothetical protein
MKTDELVRNVPANIHDLRLALAGLPKKAEHQCQSKSCQFQRKLRIALGFACSVRHAE